MKQPAVITLTFLIIGVAAPWCALSMALMVAGFENEEPEFLYFLVAAIVTMLAFAIIFSVASCPLLLVSQHPAMLIGVVSFWVVSISAGALVSIARTEAELGIENKLWRSQVKDPLSEHLHRIASEDVLKALASIELVGRRLRDALRSSQESVLNPEIQKQLTAWLDRASHDLAQARDKLDELLGAALPERSNPSRPSEAVRV